MEGARMSSKYETEEVQSVARMYGTDLLMAYNILVQGEPVSSADKDSLKAEGFFGSPAEQASSELDD